MGETDGNLNVDQKCPQPPQLPDGSLAHSVESALLYERPKEARVPPMETPSSPQQEDITLDLAQAHSPEGGAISPLPEAKQPKPKDGSDETMTEPPQATDLEPDGLYTGFQILRGAAHEVINAFSRFGDCTEAHRLLRERIKDFLESRLMFELQIQARIKERVLPTDPEERKDFLLLMIQAASLVTRSWSYNFIAWVNEQDIRTDELNELLNEVQLDFHVIASPLTGLVKEVADHQYLIERAIRSAHPEEWAHLPGIIL